MEINEQELIDGLKICQVCGKSFHPRQKNQVLCGDFDCKRELKRRRNSSRGKDKAQDGPGQEIGGQDE